MKYLVLLFFLVVATSCNKQKQKIDINTNKKVFENYFDCEVVEHYYINKTEKEISLEIRKKKKNNKELLRTKLLISVYPDNISENNIESTIINSGFKLEILTNTQKNQIDNIFKEKDSIKKEFSSCIPYYRDVLIFKKNQKIVGLSKICFGCGVIQIIGSTKETDGFGIESDIKKLKKILKR